MIISLRDPPAWGILQPVQLIMGQDLKGLHPECLLQLEAVKATSCVLKRLHIFHYHIQEYNFQYFHSNFIFQLEK